MFRVVSDVSGRTMSTVKVQRGERVKWLKELISPKKTVPPPADAPPTTVVWKETPTPERPPDFGTSSQFLGHGRPPDAPVQAVG
jgi:hypothetical protein